ncbi:hypothetical protein KAU32_12920 [bacterium]|nr:hypothetical protein [bacterium]
MAISKCAKCGSTLFEVKDAAPQGSRFKISFVQCTSCGTVIGVLEYFNAPSILINQNRAIEKIANKLGMHIKLEP